MKKNLTLKIKDLALLKSQPIEYYRREYKWDEKTPVNISLNKSYSHKPALQNLPYDRNSKNPDKMCARYLACKELEEYTLKNLSTLKDFELRESLDVLRKEKEELDAMKREHEEHQKIYDRIETENKLRLEEKLDEVKQIMDGFDEYSKRLPNDINGKILNIKKEVFGDNDAFITEEQQKYLNDLANDLDDWIERGGFLDERGFLTPQGDEISALGTYIRDLGSNRENERLLQLRARPPYVTEKDLESENFNIEMKVADVKEAKRECQRQKDSIHKLTTQLLDVVDEEMNCVDVFEKSTGGVYADVTPVQDIEKYINNYKIKDQLNKDGTLKESYINRDKMDWHENWADHDRRPYPE